VGIREWWNSVDPMIHKAMEALRNLKPDLQDKILGRILGGCDMQLRYFYIAELGMFHVAVEYRIYSYSPAELKTAILPYPK